MVFVNRVDVVVGGQYGSEGKGAVAAAMVEQARYNLLVRVAGPNAGHTVIDQADHKRALRQIPAAGILDHDADLYIAPGSEVDWSVLLDDIAVYEEAGAPWKGRLYMSPEATLLETRHHELEGEREFGLAGSTRKGVGAARADRAMRRAFRMVDMDSLLKESGIIVGDPPDCARAMLEGTQGYWLGTHAGLYPYCTSSDCRAIDFLAMSGLRYASAQATVVLRSFPIRIAGNSGPLEDETTWEEIGVAPEYTTVTKKMRRVGQWETGRTDDAIKANYIGATPPNIAMTFMDYVADTPAEQFEWATKLLGGWAGRLRYIGNGPDSGFWASNHSQIAAAAPPPAAGSEAGAEGRAVTPPLDPAPATDRLHRWWADQSRAEADRLVPKAVEYGSYDLRMIGEMMGEVLGRDDDTELGVLFYLIGKIARVASALRDGHKPSVDTLTDIAIYARMAIYIREHGQWP